MLSKRWEFMLESFFNAIRNLWAVDELRRRVLFTLGMLAVYRAGIHVPVPGIDQEVLKTIWGDAGNLFGVLDLFSGGNLRRISIFALGIMPYITASIILQLMTSVYPALKKYPGRGRARPAEDHAVHALPDRLSARSREPASRSGCSGSRVW